MHHSDCCSSHQAAWQHGALLSDSDCAHYDLQIPAILICGVWVCASYDARRLKLLQNSRRQTLVCIQQLFLLVKRKSHLVFCVQPWRTAKTPETLQGVMSSRKAWWMLQSASCMRSNRKPNAGLNLTTCRRILLPLQAAQHV